MEKKLMAIDEQFERQAIEEYKRLQQEILNLDQRCYQFIAISLSITALAMAQGFKDYLFAEYAFLVPIPILWVACYYIIDMRFNIRVNSSYIVSNIESKLPGLNWETKLREMRYKLLKKNSKYLLGQNRLLNELLLFNSLILASIILFFSRTNNKSLAYVFWGFFFIFFIRSAKYYKEHNKEGVKEDKLSKLWEETN
jgi:hypothetical protein